MSLVFRKAILPKNVSLFKYFKGRPLATAANKRNNGVLSTAVPNHRNFKNKARPLRVVTVKTQKTKPLPSAIQCRGGSETASLRFCASCPYIVPFSRTRHSGSPITCGPTRSILDESLLTNRTGSEPRLVPCNYFHISHSSHDAGKSCSSPPCKCCCPPPLCAPGKCCPSCCPNCCSSLPPPCNTPPKCIQYMTGYYYYPYGFWFCGPYHISGTCTPCGPCPGGSCGPCCGPPCPTCGPPCPPCPPPPCGSPPPPPCPCPKCCLCPKCCACLNPVSATVVGGDPEPRCQSVQTPPPASPYQQDIHYPLPQAAKHESGPQPRIKGGIAKFFPFHSIPALVPPRRMPHSSANVCPYSTQPLTCPVCPSIFPEQNPIFCTPCIKPNIGTRLRHPFSNYEKRSESRSPIHHKRSKKYNCELCPILESPRSLMTKEQRDRPATFPGAFQYTNIPNYRKPYPPQPPRVTEYKEYET